MAASLPSFFSLNPRFKKSNICRRLQVIKAHKYQDEGRSTNMVDANLNVLNKRIEMVKVKEKLERCCKCQHGWNYVSVNSNHKAKENKDFFSLIELASLVCGTLGLTCFGGTLFLCLVSLLVHMQL
ncbi:hypothetical protein VNO77_21632 [Canavalia gladiata]|uniref:Transmembrane protein n=1 Tax=Canavalia gladiata TaxID=3824 RepID=A0AAN9LUZ7_CANGL